MNILVTAGSTWAKIDAVRVLTNRFTGKTGLYLANSLAKKGHAVTLIINAQAAGKAKSLKTLRFCYFDQFKKKLEAELKSARYDVIIHSAAVSDYLPKKARQAKISSGRKDLTIPLKPAPKLIKIIRRLAKDSLIIQFKLEAKQAGIVQKAYKSLKANNSDYVVANALESLGSGYKAYLIDCAKKVTIVNSKAKLAQVINNLIKKPL